MKVLRGIGLCIGAFVGLAIVVFLGLVAWQLLVQFWALSLGGMAVVAGVIGTLYIIGSRDEDASPVEKV